MTSLPELKRLAESANNDPFSKAIIVNPQTILNLIGALEIAKAALLEVEKSECKRNSMCAGCCSRSVSIADEALAEIKKLGET